jgi:hypothetical protein
MSQSLTDCDAPQKAHGEQPSQLGETAPTSVPRYA